MPRILVILSFVLSAFAWPTGVAAQSTIGKAEQIKNSVRGRGSRAINRNDSIFENERIRTNRTGLGHFRFADGTKMVLGPGSNLVLDELVYNTNQTAFNRIVLRSSRGATRIISGRSRSSAFRVTTPVGVIGLRGTAFDIRHFRGRTYVMLLAGRLQVCSRINRCQNLRRKCSYVVVNLLGGVSTPVQPRQGSFSAQQMAQFFPFVNNERQLRRDYRVGTSRCRGGNISRSNERRIRFLETDPGSEPARSIFGRPSEGDGNDPSTNPATPSTPTTPNNGDNPTTTTVVTTPVDVPFPNTPTNQPDTNPSGPVSVPMSPNTETETDTDAL